MQQALHQRRHHIFVAGQRRDVLRRNPWPVNNQRNLQLLPGPVKLTALRIQRHTVRGGNNHHRIIQFSGIAQGAQYPADLVINISRRTAVATREVLLLTVIQRGAVQRNP